MGSATMTEAKGKTGWQKIARQGAGAAGVCGGGGVSGVRAAELADAGVESAAGVAGIWLRGYAAGYVKKNAELTRTGPYAYTRNPLYLGSMRIAAGFAVAAGTLVAGGAAGGDVSGDLCADDSFGGGVFARARLRSLRSMHGRFRGCCRG